MSTKLNIRGIFEDHIRTLRDSDEDAVSVIDVITFYALPLLVAVMFWMLTDKVDKNAAERIDSIIVSSFSIFAALLLNVQVLIMGVKATRGNFLQQRRAASSEEESWRRRRARERAEFLADVCSNVSYAIAVSVILVGVTLVLIFCNWDQSVWGKALQFFGIVHFVLTLLMVVKRMHVVLRTELR